LQKQALDIFHTAQSHYFANPLKENYHNDLLVIQSLIYDKILKREFSGEILCQMPVSEGYHSRSAFLNYLRFVNESKKYHGVLSECPDAAEESTDWQAVSADSRYYYLLKKRVLEDIKLTEAIRSDWLFEFDLYEFLYLNIDQWKPKGNYYMDREIDAAKMDELIRELLNNPGRLCRDQAHHLAVKFYAKVIDHSLMPGKTDEELLEKAAEFLEEHYLRYSSMLSEQEAEMVIRQLLIANHKSFTNERLKFSDKLRQKVSAVLN
jgi:hypothetical protein